MPASRSDLMRRLGDLRIAVHTVEHPAVFTVAESSALHRDIPGGHTKNLFLADSKGRLFLIIAHADTRADLKALAKALGAAGRLSFGRPDVLAATLGVTPGSVTALSLINDVDNAVTVVIDANLMTYPSVNCHPLENTATTNIARDDLLRFIRACGHEPHILYIGTEGRAPQVQQPAIPDGPDTGPDGGGA